MIQADLFTDDVLSTAKANIDKLSPDFVNWLGQNVNIWNAFVKESFKIWAKGFTHYSARTICEFLRHHSSVSDADGTWKINNNYPPYLARLFILFYPHMDGLFEFRLSTKASRQMEVSHDSAV